MRTAILLILILAVAAPAAVIDPVMPKITSDWRDVLRLSEPVCDVKAYGALGDGSTDDTAAVQAAATAAAGKVLIFPAGTYVLDGVALHSETLVCGAGREATTLKLKDSAAGDIFSITSKSNVVVRDMTFDMNAAAQGTPTDTYAHCAIDANTVNYLSVANCRFENLFECAVNLYHCNFVWLENSYFTGDIVGSPVSYSVTDVHATTCSDVWIDGNRFDHGTPVDADHAVVAVFLASCTRVRVTGNHIDNCGRSNGGGHQGAAIDLYARNADCTIKDNTVDDFWSWGLRVRGHGVVVSGNYFAAAAAATVNAALELSQGDGVAPYDVVVENNEIHTNAANGIGVSLAVITPYDEPCDVTIAANRIYGYRNIRVMGAMGLDIRGNILTPYNQGLGLAKGTGLDINDVTITGNRVYAENLSSTDAFYLKMTDRCIVADNLILDAYQGMAFLIDSGGYVHDNIVQASDNHYEFFNATQGLRFEHNLAIGTGDKIWQQGGDLTYFPLLTDFVDETPWRVFYSNTDGDVTELALGPDGTYLKSNGAAAAPTWGTPAGGGDMLKATYDTDSDNDIDVAAGGTEKSSWTQYAIPYLSDTTVFGEIEIGTAGQYLKVNQDQRCADTGRGHLYAEIDESHHERVRDHRQRGRDVVH